MTEAERQHNEAVAAASRAFRAAEEARDRDVAAVQTRHAPAIRAAREVMMSARAAREALLAEEGASHPWIGKRGIKVVRRDTSSPYRRESRWETTTTYGVFEVLGPANPWTGPHYQNPGAGTLVVRLLKKDGKPGVRMEQYSAGARDEWKLDETHPA